MKSAKSSLARITGWGTSEKALSPNSVGNDGSELVSCCVQGRKSRGGQKDTSPKMWSGGR